VYCFPLPASQTIAVREHPTIKSGDHTHYAGGRTMNTGVLRDTFQNLLKPAKELQTQYLQQMRQQAETIDMNRVMGMIRGG
jgi:hypothetical protein